MPSAPARERVIGAMTRCRCVSRYGVGYDNVDTASLKARGIALEVTAGEFADLDGKALGEAITAERVRRLEELKRDSGSRRTPG